MKIPEFCAVMVQEARLGANVWSVARLFKLVESLPVIEIPLDHLSVGHKYDPLSIREMVMHMKAVLAADLSYPIILDEDGEILDGRHRIMKALLEGRSTIKAVRFDINPDPCKVLD
jgi:hypothetical protein